MAEPLALAWAQAEREAERRLARAQAEWEVARWREVVWARALHRSVDSDSQAPEARVAA